MDDANTTLGERSPKDNASWFGVMTGCFALVFLVFSVLTIVALGKRWAESSSISSTNSSRIEEPRSRAISDPPAQVELQAWVRLPDRSKGLPAVVREGPGTGNPKIAELTDGTAVVILGESFVTEKANGAGKWFKIRASRANRTVVGWMHSDIVKP